MMLIFLSPTQVNNGSRLADVEVIEAGNGHDVIDLSSFQFTYGDVEIYGGTGNDVLWSNKGNDKLYGEDGNDNLQGGKGADVLFGGSGEDILKGYTGNDQLNGGEGKDSLFGGSGNDLFVFSHLTDSNSENMDEILDFTQNEDQIDVSQLEVTDISDFHFSFDGINTVVNAVDSDFAFQLEGQFELNNNDFIFG
jgi:Ca2+-binding RTX toxin-like protein